MSKSKPVYSVNVPLQPKFSGKRKEQFKKKKNQVKLKIKKGFIYEFENIIK